jgi:hypothetical protein
MVLKYGPQGTGKGEPLRELDGQTITLREDGVLFINDERSPYHLMSVLDYREYLIMPFLLSRSSTVKNKFGQEVKISTRGRGITRENLPPWPSSVPKPKAKKKVKVKK